MGANQTSEHCLEAQLRPGASRQLKSLGNCSLPIPASGEAEAWLPNPRVCINLCVWTVPKTVRSAVPIWHTMSGCQPQWHHMMGFYILRFTVIIGLKSTPNR